MTQVLVAHPQQEFEPLKTKTRKLYGLESAIFLSSDISSVVVSVLQKSCLFYFTSRKSKKTPY